MTANAMQGDRDKCIEAGMDDYLAKPVNPHDLADMLAKWLPSDNGDDKGGTEEILEDTDKSTEQIDTIEALVFDPAILMGRLGNDKSLFDEIVALFLNDMPPKLEEMKECIEEKDLSGVECLAHTIKGVAANVGGEALCEAAHSVETNCKSEDIESVRVSFDELEREYFRTTKAMGKEK